MMNGELRLRVVDARQSEIGESTARINNTVMRNLKISEGDFIEIHAKKITVAVASLTYPSLSSPEDQIESQNTIRIDEITRGNAGAALGEYASIKPANVAEAQSIVFAPTDIQLSVDQGFVDFVKTRFINKPFREGDRAAIPIFGIAGSLVVLRTRPQGAIKITGKTDVQVLGEPISEARALGKGYSKVTYRDIGGLHKTMQRIQETVELPLKRPELFGRLGVEPPRAVLVYGSEGCGKTLLAKAVANELDVSFHMISGSELAGKIVGESEARLKEIFSNAQEEAPSIVFIDELEIFAPRRELAGEVDRRVVSLLARLIDDIMGDEMLIVMGATSRPNDVDPSLRRPGRFEVEIEIPIPGTQERLEILEIHSQKMPLAKDVDVNQLAEVTKGYTGADLAALCRKAAIETLMRYLPQIKSDKQISSKMLERIKVSQEDFMAAHREHSKEMNARACGPCIPSGK